MDPRAAQEIREMIAGAAVLLRQVMRRLDEAMGQPQVQGQHGPVTERARGPQHYGDPPPEPGGVEAGIERRFSQHTAPAADHPQEG